MPSSSHLELLEPSRTHLRGYADALARGVGLEQVVITTATDNTASQRVIEANGGRLVGEFRNLRFGTAPRLRYVVDLAGQ